MLGLDATDYSLGYIASWSEGDPQVIAALDTDTEDQDDDEAADLPPGRPRSPLDGQRRPRSEGTARCGPCCVVRSVGSAALHGRTGRFPVGWVVT